MATTTLNDLHERGLKIAIASGKGGTGKTTMAVNLALYLAGQGRRPVLMDLDVEEPNCAELLAEPFRHQEPVELPLPVADETSCARCGLCAEVCAYNAIAVTAEGVMVFEDLCHFCGRCGMRCPKRAMTTRPHRIGLLRRASRDGLDLIDGLLDTGQMQTSHLIDQVKATEPSGRLVLRDCPPGTTCPMVASVRGADYVVLVTEPTPFGRHDLGLAVEALEKLGLPHGVVINKSDGRDDVIERHATEKGYPVLGRIPLSREFAQRGAEGLPLVDLPEFRERLGGIAEALFAAAGEACVL